MKQTNKLMKRLLTVVIMILGFSAYSQSTLTGTVKDATNEPLPGVSILVKGTTNGTLTDFDGNYSIQLNTGDVLEFNFLGFEDQEFIFDGQQTFDAILKESTNVLDEVVITGYGKQSRETLTSAIATMDTKVLENIPYANAGSAMQGTVAGVRVQTTSGQPGSSPRIVIRGGTSIDDPNGASPLYVIDGVQRADMDGLNPADIETLQVLKDAAASAIYGSQSSNGVVIITTKSGKGKPSIKFSSTVGFSQLGKTYDMGSARDYIYYGRLGIAATAELPGRESRIGRLDLPVGAGTGNNLENNTGFTTQYLQPGYNDHKLDEGWESMPDPIDPSKTIIFKETNWQDELFRTGISTNNFIEFSGATDAVDYAMSIGYFDAEGVAIGTNYQRLTGSLYGGFKIKPKFKVWGRMNFSRASDNEVYSSNHLFQRALGLPPTAKMFFEDGTLAPGQNRSIGNPVYHLDRVDNDNRENTLTLSTGFDWEIVENLTFSPSFSLFQETQLFNGFQKSYNNNATQFIDSRNMQGYYEQTEVFQAEGVFTYANVFKEVHSLTANAGYSYRGREFYSLDARGRGASSDLIPTLNAAAEPTSVSSFFSQLNVLGFFARASYDYKQKYLFTASFRYDGASNLGDNKKWASFPGISAGWNMHKEDFWNQDSDVFNALKIRASYGVTGNIKDLSDFHYQGQYSVGGLYNSQPTVQNTRLSNNDLQWEQSKTIDLGFDLGMWNNRVTLLFDWYKSTTQQLLTDFVLPQVTGFSSIRTNLGDLENKGYEFEIHALVMDKENFTWNLDFNTAHNENKVLKLPENGLENNRIGGLQVANPKTGELDWVGGKQEGQRLGEYYTYTVEGVYATTADAEAGPEDELVPGNVKTKRGGDIIFKDVDGNGVINSYDREYAGNQYPTMTGGMSNHFKYKNFGLSIRVDWATGHTILNRQMATFNGQWQGDINITTDILRSWENEGDVTNVPRYYWADQLAQNSTFRNSPGTGINMNSEYFEKGDYLAFREITFSYTFPHEMMNKVGIDNLRFYATGANLGYLTTYRGLMPEDGGWDSGRYPTPQSLLLGLNISF